MTLRHLILFLCMAAGAATASAAAPKPEMRYVDAAKLTIVNKAQAGDPVFQRINVERYPELTATVERFYRQSSGLAILFKTDSRNIQVRWQTTSVVPQSNVMLIATRGLDLYIRHNGEWTFAGSAAPQKQDVRHSAPLVENMEEGMRECMLYLPLYDEVTSLEIGIDANAEISALKNPFRHKVVVVGSSITHCASVSRPGMAYPAQLSRRMDVEMANLGACGVCKMEDFYAHIIADTKAEAFIFDAFSNPSPTEITERLERFIGLIRKSHPTTPLIFLQTERRETIIFDTKKRSWEERKRKAAEEIMVRMIANDKNLYWIDPGLEIGDDHEATSDGVHPSDLGVFRIVENLQPRLEKILGF